MNRRMVLLIDRPEAMPPAERAQLGDAGYDVLAMTRAIDLDARLRDVRPDVAVVNVELVNGDAAVRARVIDLMKGSSLPVVMTSGLPADVIASRVRAAGAAAYVQGPLTAARLRVALDSIPTRDVVPARTRVEPGVEKRRDRRFALTPPMGASFGSAALEVWNLSRGGALVRHNNALRPAAAGRLVILERALPAVAVRATVMWTRVQPSRDSSGQLCYLSGLRFEESEPFAAVLERLVAANRVAAVEHYVARLPGCRVAGSLPRPPRCM